MVDEVHDSLAGMKVESGLTVAARDFRRNLELAKQARDHAGQFLRDPRSLREDERSVFPPSSGSG